MNGLKNIKNPIIFIWKPQIAYEFVSQFPNNPTDSLANWIIFSPDLVSFLRTKRIVGEEADQRFFYFDGESQSKLVFDIFHVQFKGSM